jgi:hypothetical protein
MAWFRKKTDPISDRANALNDEIAQLESKIKKLDLQLQRNGGNGHAHSTNLVRELQNDEASSFPEEDPKQTHHEPIFVKVDREMLEARNELGTTPAHYNDLGVRKYDLPALLRRIKGSFRRPSTTNPKLVSYLAAGGIQGLRPLRYEKRVARNRFIAFVILLFLTLLGVVTVFVKHR